LGVGGGGGPIVGAFPSAGSSFAIFAFFAVGSDSGMCGLDRRWNRGREESAEFVFLGGPSFAVAFQGALGCGPVVFLSHFSWCSRLLGAVSVHLGLERERGFFNEKGEKKKKGVEKTTKQKTGFHTKPTQGAKQVCWGAGDFRLARCCQFFLFWGAFLVLSCRAGGKKPKKNTKNVVKPHKKGAPAHFSCQTTGFIRGLGGKTKTQRV